MRINDLYSWFAGYELQRGGFLWLKWAWFIYIPNMTAGGISNAGWYRKSPLFTHWVAACRWLIIEMRKEGEL